MSQISLFEEKQVRRAWNASERKWSFAIVDVIAILTDSPKPQVYWRVMKKRLTAEGNETVTNCNALKMTAAIAPKHKLAMADSLIYATALKVIGRPPHGGRGLKPPMPSWSRRFKSVPPRVLCLPGVFRFHSIRQHEILHQRSVLPLSGTAQRLCFPGITQRRSAWQRST